MKDEKKEGLKFEDRFAAIFGVKPQPGSGNQWFAKLDIDTRAILFSLKHTGKDSLSVTPAILAEAIQESTKIGSKGAIPAVAVDICGEDFTIMRSNDLALLLEEEVKLVSPRRAQIKRHRASIPEALRHAQEDEEETS